MSAEEGIDLKKPKAASKPVVSKFKLEAMHPAVKIFENSILSYEFKDGQLRLTFEMLSDTAEQLYQGRFRLANGFDLVHYDENDKPVLRISPNAVWSHVDMSSSLYNNLRMTIVLNVKN